jgi:hypothetical protein
MDLLTRIRSEIDVRMSELRPALEEYGRLLSSAEELDEEIRALRGRRSRSPRRATGTGARANGAGPGGRGRAPRAPRGAAQQSIMAALEHGSHTVSELAVVTAMPGPSIRQSLRRLLVTGTVTRSKRDGKTAYALSSPRR